ncbi:MAG: hypothetical protein E7447_01025 [Ruminococcaceae bacterium]|nr:hypothetical protein [Oscillospiraceae bacterium]
MKKLLAILLCAAIVMGLAGCGSFEDVLASAIDYAESNTAQYNKILEDAGIVHASPVFGDNIFSYASVDEEGNVFCADYVCKIDVVTSWAETSYIPVEGYTEDQIWELKRALRVELDYLDLLACCSMRFNRAGNYLKVTCVFTDVNKEENYDAIYKAGLSSENATISMKASEDILLADGCVKK